MNVAIIGSGSWATALAKIVMHNATDINWYIRKQETIDEVIEIRRNPNHLEWAYFDVSRIHFSADINAVIEQSDLLVLAVPSPYLKQSLNDIKVDMSNKMVISAVKGMIPDENLLVTEYMHQYFHVPKENSSLYRYAAALGVHLMLQALPRVTSPAESMVDALAIVVRVTL